MWSAVGVCLAVEFVMLLCFLAARDEPEDTRHDETERGETRRSRQVNRE